MTTDEPSPRDEASIGASLPAWAEEAFLGDVFASGPWFRHFQLSALSADERPMYVETRGHLASARLVLPLKARVFAEFPWPRVLESMTNYYSCGFGPIPSTPPEREDLAILCSRAVKVMGDHDVIRIAPVDRDSEFARVLWESLQGRGFVSRWSLAFGNWFADVRGLDYAGYLKRAPSTFPSTCEKRRASFLRRGVGEIEIGQTTAGLQRHVDAYETVYRSSWKVPEAYPLFVPGLISLSAQRGWLRLGIAYVSGKPAAAQLWLVLDRRALIYKVAYDERFAKLSVGSILTCEMIRHVIEVDHVEELDFLSGDDPYKAKWMFDRRERHTLWAYNLTRPRGAASYARHLAGQAVDQAKRTLAYSRQAIRRLTTNETESR